MECDNLCRHPPRYINVLVRCIINASPVSMHSKSQTSPSVMLSTSSRWKVNNVGWQQFLRAHRTNKHYMIDKLLYLVLHTSSLWKLVTLLEEHTCQKLTNINQFHKWIPSLVQELIDLLLYVSWCAIFCLDSLSCTYLHAMFYLSNPRCLRQDKIF